MIKSRKAVFIGFLIVMILLCGVFMYNAVIGKRNLEKDLNSSKATDHIKIRLKLVTIFYLASITTKEFYGE